MNNFPDEENQNDRLNELNQSSPLHVGCWEVFRTTRCDVEFSDETLRERYYQFRIASTSPLFSAALAVFIGLGCITYWTIVLPLYHPVHIIILAAFSFIISVPVFFILVYLRLTLSITDQQKSYRQVLVRLQQVVSLGLIVTIGFIVIFRSMRLCDSRDFRQAWTCNPTLNGWSLPADTTFLLLMFPFLFSVIFPFLSFKNTIFNFAVAAVLCFSALSLHTSILASPSVVLMIIFSLFLIFVFHIQSMELFLYMNRYYGEFEARLEEERDLAVRLSREMSRLIGFVSHDLKSPLSAFLQGFEGLKNSAGNLVQVINSIRSDPELAGRLRHLLDESDFMKKAIDSLLGTYHVLIMIINRYTDYSKVSHQIALAPKLEVVDLKSVILAPLKAVEILQGRSFVNSLVLDPSLSDCIITDGQWLQDNLLCLVSNAAKYSLEKIPSIRITLTRDTSPDNLNDKLLRETRSSGNRKYSSALRDHQNLQPMEREMIRFEVEDDGQGFIAPDPEGNGLRIINDLSKEQWDREELKAIFLEPEFRERGGIGGAGLGLYCLAKRVEALQGEYGVSRKGNNTPGSLVWFAIPYLKASASSKPLRQCTRSLSRSSKDSIDLSGLDASFMQLSRIRSSSGSGSGSGSDGESSSKGSKLQIELVSHLGPDHPPRRGRSVSFKSENDGYKSEKAIVLPVSGPVPGPPRPTSVLIVDDSLPILKIMRMVLERNHFRVFVASNGVEAIEALQKELARETIESNSSMREESKLPLTHYPVFDAILMDLQMPKMNGIDAIRRIREIERDLNPEMASDTHHLIIAMSATSDDETVDRAFDAGADEFLSKPFEMDKFQTILQQHKPQHNSKASSVMD